MKFKMTFHTPFRVATGHARAGVDAAADPTQPLPESSLKGVMRHGATVIGVPDSLIDAVFGTARAPSPWSWGPVRFSSPVTIAPRARVELDPQTGTAVQEALLFSDEIWAERAEFDIDPIVPLPPVVRAAQEGVLKAAAASVKSLGAQRNRGLGWVSISCQDGTDPRDLAEVVLKLRGAGTC